MIDRSVGLLAVGDDDCRRNSKSSVRVRAVRSGIGVTSLEPAIVSGGDMSRIRAILSGGGRIAFPPSLGEPDIVGRLPSLLGEAPAEIVVPYRLRSTPLEGFHPNVTIRAWFGGGRVDGRDYSPGLFDKLPKLIDDPVGLPIDVALVRLTPADQNGMHNVGPSASLTGDLVRAAKSVVAEIDPDLPWTEGDTLVPSSLITATIEAEGPLPLPRATERGDSPADVQLATNVAELIPDGAYIQLGLGRTGQALVHGLRDHRNLRLHTGLINAAVQDLIDSPAVDSRWIPRFGQALGPESLMRYIDRNKSISFHSTRYIHDATVISQYEPFFSINSTLAIDLFGRISSEGSIQCPRAGLGGLVDFLIAGRVAKRGANIIALRSTSSSGESRIVPALPSLEVSVPSYLIDYVVTEWGFADLRSATRRECAERLVAVAHPEHQKALQTAFSELTQWKD